jgi:hypothetical protein
MDWNPTHHHDKSIDSLAENRSNIKTLTTVKRQLALFLLNDNVSTTHYQ